MAINGTRWNGIPRETIESFLAETERTTVSYLPGSGIFLIWEISLGVILVDQHSLFRGHQHYLAGHSDQRTTRLYNRRQKQVTRNIVERISV